MKNKELRAKALENFFLKYGPLVPQESRKEFADGLTEVACLFSETAVEDFVEKFKAEGSELFGQSRT